MVHSEDKERLHSLLRRTLSYEKIVQSEDKDSKRFMTNSEVLNIFLYFCS